MSYSPLPNTAAVPASGAILFDDIVAGLDDHLASLGFTDFKYVVTEQPKQHYHMARDNTPKPSWVASGTADLTYTRNGTPTSLFTREHFSTLADLRFDALWRTVTYHKLDLYFELLHGKYKGSIGKHRGIQWVELAKDPISGKQPSVNFLAKKNMRLRVDAIGPTLVFAKTDFEVFDSFENKIESGDILVFVESGKIAYATFVQFDPLNKRLIIKLPNGKQSDVAMSRNMMNVTKMPANVMRNEILKAQLVRGI